MSQLVLTGSRSEEAASAVVDDFTARFPALQVVYVQADLGTQDGAEAPVRRCIDAFGRIDILINNAVRAAEGSRREIECVGGRGKGGSAGRRESFRERRVSLTEMKVAVCVRCLQRHLVVVAKAVQGRDGGI